MTIVVDTVAEVMNLQKYLSAFGVEASPLIGRGERLKYINQVAQPCETLFAGIEFSQYLTPLCLVDGMDAQHSGSGRFRQRAMLRPEKREQESPVSVFSSVPGAPECSVNAIPLPLLSQQLRALRHLG